MTVTTDDHGQVDTEFRVPAAVDSPEGKLVYLSLCMLEGGTLDDLQQLTAMPKLSLFSILRNLARAGLISKHGAEYRIREC